MILKRGVKFLHARFLDSDNNPLLCEVTRVAQGVVYWKQEGEKKAHHFFPLAEADKYIKDCSTGDVSQVNE